MQRLSQKNKWLPDKVGDLHGQHAWMHLWKNDFDNSLGQAPTP